MKYLFFLLFGINAFAQEEFVVKNNLNGEPIAYVVVEAIDGTLKINTDENGTFKISKDFYEKTFVFDAVGYEVKQQPLTDVIYLEPKSELLEDLVIIPRLGTKEIKIGSLKKSEVKMSFGTGNRKNTWSFGRFFSFDSKIEETPFLKDVTFLFSPTEIETTFGIKIYEADEKGFPAELLHDELIVGTLKKKKKLSKVDLTPYQIMMKKNGIVLVFEWLIIESNFFKFHENNGNKVIGRYSPTIKGTVTQNKKQSLLKDYTLTNGKWENIKDNFMTEDTDKEIFPLIMCELTLTN